MFYKREFTVDFNIDNIKNIQNVDNIDLYLIDQLKNVYEKVCFKNCFIYSITKIKNKSFYDILNNLYAYITIKITFECIIVKYDKFEIINNVKITEISNDKIICEGENISVFIKMNEKLNTYVKNQIIPIVVGKSNYNTGKSEIPINAYPFVPTFEKNKYFKIELLTEDEKNKLNETVINQIKIEEKKINEMKKNKGKIIEYFEKLVYPYKKDKSKEIDKDTEIVDLFNMNFKGIVFQSNYDNGKDHKIRIFKNDNVDINYICDKSINIYYILFYNYLKYLILIQDLSNTYNTEKLIEDNKNIFDLYESFKK